MLRLLMAGASAVALASTAALADPAEQADEAEQTAKEATAAAATITPIEVATRADSAKLAEAEFATADADKDGALDKAEFTAFIMSSVQASPGANIDPSQAALIEKAFIAIAKKDSKISKPELAAARAKNFDEADANHDQTLDALEQQKFASLVAVRPAEANKPQ